jgi:hypothetical protein
MQVSPPAAPSLKQALPTEAPQLIFGDMPSSSSIDFINSATTVSLHLGPSSIFEVPIILIQILQASKSFQMSNLSSLKSRVISALRNPHESSKPRLKRRVLPFNEAFENLKMSKSGVVTCVALHSFGKCRKEITLFDSDFLGNLEQVNMADVQTPMKLMPLMLCSSHWEKTVYHNALFLDWLSTYGSKKDTQHYENIVIDYQSAIAIDDEEHSMPNIPMSAEGVADKQEGPASARKTSTDGELFSEVGTDGREQLSWNSNIMTFLALVEIMLTIL